MELLIIMMCVQNVDVLFIGSEGLVVKGTADEKGSKAMHVGNNGTCEFIEYYE